MTSFSVGDKVRATRTVGLSGVREGDLGIITAVNADGGYIKMDSPRERLPIARRSDGAHWYFSSGDDWLELVDSPAAAEEKMIPASKVREIAQAYAKRHGWCDVVDDALEEMGVPKPAPEMVEVTFTQTRVVRLREKDLPTLCTAARLDVRTSAISRLDAMFNGDAPDAAELVSATWERSEPRKLSDKG